MPCPRIPYDFPVGVSTATAAVLGLSRHRVRARATTAYLLIGTGCRGGCAFCSMTSSRFSGSVPAGESPKLSRVSWPIKKSFEVLEALASHSSELKRVCLQVVKGMEGHASDLVGRIKAISGLSVSVSCSPRNLEEAAGIMDAGADYLGISLDAATPEIYAALKRGDFSLRLGLIADSGRRWPGRITTHLIFGLGETERQMCGIMDELCRCKVLVALFAFTPLPGTPMAGSLAPEIGAYRRMQFFLGFRREELLEALPEFDESGRITGLKSKRLDPDLYKSVLMNSLMTSGCPGCNRPFYNERVSSTPYNFPVRPTVGELTEAIRASGLRGLC